jgi:arylsulfatase A-like enzyme
MIKSAEYHLQTMKTLLFILTTLLLPLTTLRAAPQPNILYILADDMGYGDPGFMGSKDLRTPNIDKLARDGTILSAFYVQPVCSPTRSTLMTGRYVMRTGVYTVVKPHAPWGLPLGERTLAQALREAGYETAITGKWHLGEFEPGYLPTHRGFDHQYGLWFGMIDYFTHRRGQDLDWHRDDRLCQDQGYSTFLIAKEACRLIREKSLGKPLFLYLPFNAVHAPLEVPQEYLKPYANLPTQRKTYAGMVAAMDEAIGQVVAALEERKMRDNTLIIFSSDNGGPWPGRVTDNGPLRAGKGTIYEGGIRVCACVNWPGHIPAGKTIAEPLQGVDWYPTLIKLAGGSLGQKLPLDGKDIWPVLTGEAKSPHDALLLCGTRRNVTAIRMGDWKLLLHPNRKDAEESGVEEAVSAKVELYNLANDLGEKHDLSKSNPEKAKELRARLDAWMQEAVPPGDAAAPPVQNNKRE